MLQSSNGALILHAPLLNTVTWERPRDLTARETAAFSDSNALRGSMPLPWVLLHKLRKLIMYDCSSSACVYGFAANSTVFMPCLRKTMAKLLNCKRPAAWISQPPHNIMNAGRLSALEANTFQFFSLSFCHDSPSVSRTSHSACSFSFSSSFPLSCPTPVLTILRRLRKAWRSQRHTFHTI